MYGNELHRRIIVTHHFMYSSFQAIVDISKENLNRDPNMSRRSAACNMSFGTPSMGLPQSTVASPFGTPHSVRPLQRAFSSAHVGDVSTSMSCQRKWLEFD